MTKSFATEDPMAEIMQILREAEMRVEGVQGVAVVSADGLPMASAIEKVEEAELAALVSSMLSIGSDAVANLKKGDLDCLYVKCDKGYILLRYSGPLAVVVMIASEEARLGPLLLELERTAKKIEKYLMLGG